MRPARRKTSWQRRGIRVDSMSLIFLVGLACFVAYEVGLYLGEGR